VNELAILHTKRKKTGIPTTEYFSRSLLYRFITSSLSEWRLLLRLLWPYTIPLFSFLLFILWNDGSIVVGDKEHHQPVFHFAQLPYFFTVAALVSSPELLMSPRSVPPFWSWVLRQGTNRWCCSGRSCCCDSSSCSSSSSRSRSRSSSSVYSAFTLISRPPPPPPLPPLGIIKLLLLLTTAIYLLHHYSLTHPFLLAANRHYTFYIRRRLFLPIPHLNIVLLPFYLFWSWLVLSRLRQGSSSLQATIFTIALSLVLLPAHLVEPRYFNIPLAMVLLDTPPRSGSSTVMTIAVMVVVNAITIYIFLYRPFTWVDGTTARFMW